MGRLLASNGAGGATRRARVLAAVAMATVVLALTPAAGVGADAADPRARRAELLLRAAALTDQLERSEADVVAGQLRREAATGSLDAARRRVRARAVAAYMRGTGAAVAALGAPGAYLDVVAAKEREVLARYRSAVQAAGDEQRRAEEARRGLRAARAELAAVQADLDAWIGADDARRAEDRSRADEARAAALARKEAAAAEARRRAAAAVVGGSPGGYAPSPLDPDALLPRHRAATERQLALMRRVAFGPVSATGVLPGGLVPTGRRVDGDASWYGPGFNGRPTASGAIYDQEAWTVASRDLPLGTLLVVSRGDRRVLLLVNDRGPYVDGRVLDLSAAAARALGVGGVARVLAEVVAAAA